MINCPRCGHQNLPNYPSCSQCGAALSGGGPAAPVPGGDEYAQLMARRAATARRNRLLYALVGVAALGIFGWKWVQDSHRKGDAQAKLDFAGRWVELDKRETGLFWNCVMASEIDVGLFSNANQVQQRVEAAYA